MVLIKTYCYSEHEIDFIEAQLVESEGFVDKIILYEYNVTHRGQEKPYRLNNLVNDLNIKYNNRIIYRPVDIKNLCVETNDSGIIHSINEPVQRSYLFNDIEFDLQDKDIIIDVDVDEIIYRKNYIWLLALVSTLNIPIGLRLNQFIYKTNYHWIDANFKSPSIYTYRSVKNLNRRILNDFKVLHQRDLRIVTPFSVGAHMSWIMPIDNMIRKLNSYSHPEYIKFADRNMLMDAIANKEYIFNQHRKFTINELNLSDIRIPSLFRQ